MRTTPYEESVMTAVIQEAAQQDIPATREQLYLVVLEGGGDIQVTLVNKAVWDWIDLPFDSLESGYYEAVPQAVLDEARRHDSESYFKDGTMRVTVGSYDNDRALFAPGRRFDEVDEAHEYAKANNVDIVDTYEGCIY
jgi:hypothetical protein